MQRNSGETSNWTWHEKLKYQIKKKTKIKNYIMGRLKRFRLQ